MKGSRALGKIQAFQRKVRTGKSIGQPILIPVISLSSPGCVTLRSHTKILTPWTILTGAAPAPVKGPENRLLGKVVVLGLEREGILCLR